ncbi:hypothetical protein TRFO_20831 [Tritrichomonas foetus]|uniref:Uncharacterized protein n=1 Tax=Tritrichomonas foetus TaxID=1144522 RepID=A0A1J4KKX7_9EUKA|nr:hypothetical protein TRFO_20831 [Tritrichomonas foetus]|eukprot:OHT10029.1 hypothetical protein TRFO_20831 [Tritrichomonas foetus]
MYRQSSSIKGYSIFLFLRPFMHVKITPQNDRVICIIGQISCFFGQLTQFFVQNSSSSFVFPNLMQGNDSNPNQLAQNLNNINSQQPPGLINTNSLTIDTNRLVNCRNLNQNNSTSLSRLNDSRNELVQLHNDIENSRGNFKNQTQSVVLQMQNLQMKNQKIQSIETSLRQKLQSMGTETRVGRPPKNNPKVNQPKTQKSSNKNNTPRNVKNQKKQTTRGSERSIRSNDRYAPQTTGNKLDIWVRSTPFFQPLPTAEDIEEVCKEIIINENPPTQIVTQHWSERMKSIVFQARQDNKKFNRQILQPPGPPPTSEDTSKYWIGKSTVYPMEDLQRQNSSIVHCLLSAFVKAEPLQKCQKQDSDNDDQNVFNFYNRDLTNSEPNVDQTLTENNHNHNTQINQNDHQNNNENNHENNSNESKNKNYNENNNESHENINENNYHMKIENNDDKDDHSISNNILKNTVNSNQIKNDTNDNTNRGDEEDNYIYHEEDYIPTHIPVPHIEYDDYLSHSFEERLEMELLAAGIKRPHKRASQQKDTFGNEIEQFREELNRLQPQINEIKEEILQNLPTYKRDEERRMSEQRSYFELMKDIKKRPHTKKI